MAGDACWLRPENDVQHINVAELGCQCSTSMEGNRTALIHRFCMGGYSTLSQERPEYTQTLSEMFIRSRLSTIEKLLNECNLSVSTTLVKSNQNRTDKLTKVPPMA